MILAIVIAFFSVILLMIVHEFGHFVAAKKSGINVDEFGVGYPPRIFSKKFGKTVYSLNLLPFGAFVKIPGEEGGIEDYQSFVGLPMWKRVFIVLGGVISFWVTAAIIFIIVFSMGVAMPITDEGDLAGARVQILKVYQGSPADTAGIKSGDFIKELWVQESDKKTISKVKDFQDFVSANKGEQVVIVIQRGDQVLETSLVPRISPPQDEGSIGVQIERTVSVINKYPWYQAPIEGIAYCGELTYRATGSLIGLLKDLILGRGVPAGTELTGPVGITVFLARAAELGVGFFLYFIGSISVLLAICNLLPIPALDGGKLVFLAIEKIRSKAVSSKIEQRITVVCFFLLITVSIFVTIKFDIPNLFKFIKGF